MLTCDELESRNVPATAAVAAGLLTVSGTSGDDRITVFQRGTDIIVLDGTQEVFSTPAEDVTNLLVLGFEGNDKLRLSPTLALPTQFTGGSGDDKIVAGAGNTVMLGGAGNDALYGGNAGNTFNADGGANTLIKVREADIVFPGPADRILRDTAVPAVNEVLTNAEVQTLLNRAAAASASTDAIIVITDRNGRILGVRVESGVDPNITGDVNNLVFAVDGAVALARTGAFFGNNQAPLTSRTVQFISQSTITQREVESNPNITAANSPLRGPGFVAPVNIGNHFPPAIALTPQVDLFQIEHTNRDSSSHPGSDHIKGTGDDVALLERFNINPAFVPDGKRLFAPDSFGVVSGLLPGAQGRGIATLPGGIPIFKNGQVVGGIGVFFPGKTGYATESNSSLSFTYDPSKPDRTLEAEWIAYAAVGGTRISVGGAQIAPVDDLNGVALPAGFGLPNGRIDLVGITLDVFGQGGAEGLNRVLDIGNLVGRGNPNDGANIAIGAGPNLIPGDGDDLFTRGGFVAPDGWLVLPHDGDGITQKEVETIITNSIAQSNLTRAAIRLPLGSRARFVFAVSDRSGNVVGLYREPDATIFSIDVAVAKARNVMYYADPTQYQTIDHVGNAPPGTAFTNRTFRYLGLPRFPEGIDGTDPGAFSQLNDDPLGTSRTTGLLTGAPLSASAYQSVVGYDSFNPGTNFHQTGNVLNQNGIVFFPGSAPLYRTNADGSTALIGGFGVSGDGVDQDDVTTDAGQLGFNVPLNVLHADQVFVQGIRLPYQKFNRNPEG